MPLNLKMEEANNAPSKEELLLLAFEGVLGKKFFTKLHRTVTQNRMDEGLVQMLEDLIKKEIQGQPMLSPPTTVQKELPVSWQKQGGEGGGGGSRLAPISFGIGGGAAAGGYAIGGGGHSSTAAHLAVGVLKGGVPSSSSHSSSSQDDIQQIFKERYQEEQRKTKLEAEKRRMEEEANLRMIEELTRKDNEELEERRQRAKADSERANREWEAKQVLKAERQRIADEDTQRLIAMLADEDAADADRRKAKSTFLCEICQGQYNLIIILYNIYYINVSFLLLPRSILRR